MPAQHSDEGAILAERELAADKTLALTGRAEPRDYIDFRALAQRFSLNEICELAGAKDAGFAPTLLAEALDYIDEHPRALFDLDDDAYQQLVALSPSRPPENFTAPTRTATRRHQTMESGQAPIPADFSALSDTATPAACQSSNPP